MDLIALKDYQNISLPLTLSEIKAGFPSPAEDYIDKEIDLNEHIIKDREATFLARVEGDSMEETLKTGDLLVIDKSITPKHNDIVVAVLDGEFTVKRLLKEGCKVTLQPDNPNYQPIELREGMEFLVWGVVTYSIKEL